MDDIYRDHFQNPQDPDASIAYVGREMRSRRTWRAWQRTVARTSFNDHALRNEQGLYET